MRHTLLTTLFLFSIAFSYSQSNYKKGYIISNETSERTSGYFKKVKWDFSPTAIIFKEEGASKFERIAVDKLKEFRIENESKFVIARVAFDPSNDYENLSLRNDLNLQETTVALEILVEGEKTLLKYKTKALERYFYQLPGNKIEPLLYKRYNLVLNELEEIVFREKENTAYILQLKQNISCNPNDPEEQMPTYDQESLKSYFVKSHLCSESEALSFVSTYDKATFQYIVLGGLSRSQLTAISSGYNPDINKAEYGEENGYFFGLGLSVLSPSKKISFQLESAYYSPYSSEAMIIKYPEKDFENPIPINVDYSFLRITAGANYYLLISNDLSFYITGKGNLDFTINNDILVHPEIIKSARPRESLSEEERTRRGRFRAIPASVSIGFGIRYRRASIEVNTFTDKDLFRADLESGMNQTTFQLSYIIF